MKNVVRTRGRMNSDASRRARRNVGRRALAAVALLSVAAMQFPSSVWANTGLDVQNGSTDLTSPTTYSNNTPNATSDITFTSSVYSPTTFTVGSNLGIGTLNDLDITQILTIQNGTNNSAATLTLNGGESLTGPASTDLLYVASGGTLNLVGTQGTAAVLNVALAKSGDFEIQGTSTISSVISGTGFGFNKTGAGTLTLSGVNTFTGTLGINAGKLVVSTNTNLGGGPISLNGGILSTIETAQLTMGAVQIITVGANGGTIDNAVGQKFLISTAGGLTGSGTLTRTASANNSLANILSITVANTGFTGAVILNGGVTEISANGLGNGLTAGNSITVNNGGELAVSNNTMANAITVNAGGVIGGDNGTSTLSGAITVNGAFKIRLGDFYNATTARSLNITGPLSGSGAFTLLGPGTVTAGAGQVLTLSGNNSGYSANINIAAGFAVAFTNANSIGTGTLTVNSNATALGGIGFGYDFGATPPAFTNLRTSTTTGGVFGIDSTLPSTTTLNLATLGGGGMFLGSQSAGTYSAPTLGADGTTYRLGGGGGTLTITATTLADNGAPTGLVIGDTRVGGAGTIVLGPSNSFSGGVIVNTGTASVSSIGSVGATASSFGAAPSIAAGTIHLGSGTAAVTLKYTGTGETTDRVLDFSGTTGTVTLDQSGTGLLRFTSSPTFTGAGAKTLTLQGSTAGTGQLDGVIADNSATNLTTVTKTGSGTWFLTGNNTYTGETVFNAGILNVASLGNYGVASPVGGRNTGTTETATPGLHFTGGTLQYTGSTATSTNRAIRVSTAGGTIDASGANPSATVSFTAATSPNLYESSGARTFTFTGTNTGNNTFGTALTDQNSSTGKSALTKTGVGTWVFTGVNSYSGTTTLNAGTLRFQASGAQATALPIGSAVSLTGSSTLSVHTDAGGTVAQGNGITPTVAGTYTIDVGNTSGTTTGSTIAFGALSTGVATANLTNTFNFTGSNGYNQTFTSLALPGASGATTFLVPTTTSVTLGAVSNQETTTGTGHFDTLTLDGTSTGNVITGVIADSSIYAAVGSADTRITKQNTSTWTLSGLNTYHGPTAVNGGTLVVASTGSLANTQSIVTANNGTVLTINGTTGASSPVTIAANTSLGGTGTISGATTVATGGRINLGDGTIGTLTFGSTLAFSGTSAAPSYVTFDLGNGTATDKIAATGNVTNAGGVVVNFNQLTGTTLNDGTYTLISSGGTASTLNGYSLATTQAFGHSFSLATATQSAPLAVIVSTLMAGPAGLVWSGATDNTWTNAGNWNTDVSSGTPANAIPGVGSNVAFYTTTPVATNLSTTLGSDFEINSLSFLSTATSPVTIAGATNTLAIDASGTNGNIAGNGITDSAEGVTHSISAKVALGSSQTWTVGPASGSSTAALTVSGAITDLGNNFSLTKAGTGTLTLTGASVYAGGTNLTAGTLSVGTNGGALGTGSVAVAAGTNLNITTGNLSYTFGGLSGSGTVNLTALGTGSNSTQFPNLIGTTTSNFTGTLNIGGTSSGSTVAAGAGKAILNAALSPSASINVLTNGTLYASSTFTQPAPVVLNGGDTGESLGQLRVENATYSGSITLAGNITGTSDAFLGSNGTATGTISGVVGESGASRVLSKTGTGIIVLSNANTYSGGTNLLAGTLRIFTDSSLGGTSASAPGNVTFVAASTLQFQNAITLAPTRNIILTAAGTFDTSLTAASATTTIPGTISGAGALVKSYATQGFATNPLVLSGNNTFTGNVTATSGWITATNSASFGTGTKTIGAQTNLSSDSIHLDPSRGSTPGTGIVFPSTFSFSTSNDTFATANTGTIVNDSGNNVINGTVTMTSGGGGTILASAAGTITFAGNITSNSTGRSLKLRGDGNGIISGNILEGSTFQLPVSKDLGTGTWTLTGSNTYGGNTTVSVGAVKIGNATALGYNPTTLGPGTAAANTTVASGAVLDLNGAPGTIQEQIIISGAGIGGSGALTNTGASASTIGSGLSSLGITTASGYSSAPTLTLTGGGGSGATATASLGVTTASFTVSGGTTVYSAAPTVTISGGGGSGAVATAVLTGGVVTGITISNPGSGYTGTPTIAFTGGTVTTTGTNPTGTGNGTNFTLGNVVITNQGSGYSTAPTVAVNGGGGTATVVSSVGGITLAGDTTIGGTGDIVVNGGVNESGGSRALTKIGTNTVTLGNTNSYTGATSVGAANAANAGILRLSGTGTLSNAATRVYGGTLDLNGTIQQITTLTLGGGAAGSTATVALGAGTLKLGGDVSFDATNNPNGALITSSTGLLSLNATRNFTVAHSTGAPLADLSISAVIQDGAASSGVNKQGAGTLQLTAANTYSGATNVTGGLLLVDGSTASASAVAVNTAGAVGGKGTIGGAVTLAGGGSITAGDSLTDASQTATLTIGSAGAPASASLGSGATYVWKINNGFAGADLKPSTGTAGVAGTADGWDLLHITGSLISAATSASPFTIKIVGNENNLPFATPGSASQTYTYGIAVADGGLSQFDPSKYVVDQSSFIPTAGGPFGTFTVAQDTVNPNQIDLVYATPTPEPVTMGIVGLGVLVLVRRPRRRGEKDLNA